MALLERENNDQRAREPEIEILDLEVDSWKGTVTLRYTSATIRSTTSSEGIRGWQTKRSGYLLLSVEGMFST